MFEVYYRQPQDFDREARLTAQVSTLCGRYDFWELSHFGQFVCLTFEFDDLPEAASSFPESVGLRLGASSNPAPPHPAASASAI
jgi:hypothetical protein